MMKKNFLMKNTVPVFGAALILMAALVLAGCGGDNPKKLAKETYDLSLQAVGALLNPSKAADLKKKAETIEKKVAKLSDQDKAIYNEELVRLGGSGLGGLFNAANGLKNAADNIDVDKALKDADKAAKDAQQLLDTASNVLGGKEK